MVARCCDAGSERNPKTTPELRFGIYTTEDPEQRFAIGVGKHRYGAETQLRASNQRANAMQLYSKRHCLQSCNLLTHIVPRSTQQYPRCRDPKPKGIPSEADDTWCRATTNERVVATQIVTSQVDDSHSFYCLARTADSRTSRPFFRRRLSLSSCRHLVRQTVYCHCHSGPHGALCKQSMQTWGYLPRAIVAYHILISQVWKEAHDDSPCAILQTARNGSSPGSVRSEFKKRPQISRLVMQ